jgi:membrane-associated phospholipid phosphatase
VSADTAQSTVLGVILVVGAVVAWDNIKRTGKATPSGKSLVAFTILAAGLAIGAKAAPSIVGPFALLIGLSVVVSRVGTKGAK